ncbi:MAG TPA: hypothetical protein PL001_12360, partial [Candidatus Kryptobacter bacterium]|nr:hypothetical protein [Candidatus Kryptobacter bacterium]
GLIIGNVSTVDWVAPDTAGSYTISCVVDDGHGLLDSASVALSAVQRINNIPVITSMDGKPRVVNIGGTLQLTCHAKDSDGDTLNYIWSVAAGALSGADSTVAWTAPITEGYYYVQCRVSDLFGGTTKDSIGILVEDFSKPQTGNMVAYYPLDNGRAVDSSGYGNAGFNFYAKPDTDRFGNPYGAMHFDGSTSYIEVKNSSSLDFQNAITVSFWMKADEIFNREEYPVSHNKWYRWKVSISNGHLRWSITTSAGVKDLDSDTPITADSLYFVTVMYTGSAMEIYLDGNLAAYSPWSGQLATTTVDLMI